jgi:hypothetical protein
VNRGRGGVGAGRWGQWDVWEEEEEEELGLGWGLGRAGGRNQYFGCTGEEGEEGSAEEVLGHLYGAAAAAAAVGVGLSGDAAAEANDVGVLRTTAIRAGRGRGGEGDSPAEAWTAAPLLPVR